MTVLTNSWLELPDRFYQRINPERFPSPQLLLFNSGLAAESGLDAVIDAADESALSQVCSGQKLLDGSEPIALAYAGSQFGNFVPQLGDGRAHLLGEINGLDLQLKGSGKTRFSRGGDGRCTLGAAIREFIVSEAMHHLGVPTTRALAVLATGESVYRQDGFEPGGILARMAASHIRVGTFQYFRYQQDIEALELLVDYTIRRHYPEITATGYSDRCLELLRLSVRRQEELVAKWYGLGFIHGVMNTDNCALAGITIDYGPCAFMDEYEYTKVFSSIDVHGRYGYGNQMNIVEWNILQLAECLLPFIADDPELAAEKVRDVLGHVFVSSTELLKREFARKLGIDEAIAESESGGEIATLIGAFLGIIEDNALDFTLSFASLGKLHAGETGFFPKNSDLQNFVAKWKEMNPDLALVNRANPQLIPRNHQVENVIAAANQANHDPLRELWEAVQSPYEVAEEHQHLTVPPQPHERVSQTFCGT